MTAWRTASFRAKRPLQRSVSRSGLAGFTFLELVIVVGLLALLFSVSVPSLKGLTPKYRLRTAARELGSKLEGTRLSAISRGLWMGIDYTITPGNLDDTEQSYYQVIPPAPEDFPDQPFDERERLSKQFLPEGVRIAKVTLSGNQVVDDGSASVLFSPMGNSGSHIVVLEGLEEQYLSVKMNCITGGIDFIDRADVSFTHFEE